MKKCTHLFFCIITVLLVGCTIGGPIDRYSRIADHFTTNADLIPDAILAQIKGMDVYFEHASVGSNVVGGLASLATGNARYMVNSRSIGEDNDTLSATAPDWVAANNGFVDNARGNPSTAGKITRFQSRLTGGNFASSVDVAMFKFCYIDTPSNPTATFNAVKTAMTALEAAYPATVFVWWTMPIMTTGEPLRDEYNTLVRDYCIAYNKYLLDIADIECHDPSGIALTDPNGKIMYSGYSMDEGHLNGTGALKVANAFWCLLAKICGW